MFFLLTQSMCMHGVCAVCQARTLGTVSSILELRACVCVCVCVCVVYAHRVCSVFGVCCRYGSSVCIARVLHG